MQNKGSLQHRFDNFGANASPAVWSGIASKLDANKHKKGLIIWWTTTGIAACLLTVFGLKLMGVNTTQNQAKIEQPQPKKQDIFIAPKTNKINTANIPPIDNNQQPQLTAIHKTTDVVDETNSDNQQQKPSLNENKNEISKQQTITKISNEVSEQIVVQKESFTVSKYGNIQKLNRDLNVSLTHSNNTDPLSRGDVGVCITPQTKQEPNWEFGTKIQSQIGFANTEQYNSVANSNINAFDGSINALIPPLNLKTNRPLTFKFELKRKNKKRLRFKTGLDVGWIYTQAVESIYAYNKSIITVGIPLKLDFKLLSKKRFTLHSDFGLINDIPILEFGKNELSNESTAKKVKFISGFMGGIEMGLNANYALNENIKISAGTGVKLYYLQRIKNASPLIEQSTFGIFNLGLIWRY